jgi:hypothetical protein
MIVPDCVYQRPLYGKPSIHRDVLLRYRVPLFADTEPIESNMGHNMLEKEIWPMLVERI